MKLTAILTTLVLGSSSVALADPIYRDDRVPSPYVDDYYERDYYDARSGYDHERALVARRGVLLANNVQLSSGRWDPRPRFIALDPRMTAFRHIELRADDSRTFISTVILMFADGHSQRMPIRKVLSRRNPVIRLDLPHGGVTGMYIYGQNPRGRGSFDVVAVRDRGVYGRRAPYRRY